MAFAGTKCLAGLALLLMAGTSHVRAADPEIVWYSADIPPLYIFTGSLEGSGYGDVILSLVDGGSQPKRVTVSRTWYEIEHHPVSCTTGALKTPAREAFALFSARPTMIPNYEVIIRAEDAAKLAPYMTDHGTIDLARLARQSDLVGGYIATRVYPGTLGETLAAPGSGWRMEKLSETPLLVNLLRSNRISFFFLSPVELAYYRQTIAEEDRWVGIPIEGMPSHIEAYTACSKSEAGAQVIAEVDKLFAREEEWVKVTSVLSSWESRAQLERIGGSAPTGTRLKR